MPGCPPAPNQIYLNCVAFKIIVDQGNACMYVYYMYD